MKAKITYVLHQREAVNGHGKCNTSPTSFAPVAYDEDIKKVQAHQDLQLDSWLSNGIITRSSFVLVSSAVVYL
jgi:hypothetical protein